MTKFFCDYSVASKAVLQNFNCSTAKNAARGLMGAAAGFGTYLVTTKYLKLPNENNSLFCDPLEFALEILVFSRVTIPLSIKSFEAASKLTELTLDRAQMGWSGLSQIFNKTFYQSALEQEKKLMEQI